MRRLLPVLRRSCATVAVLGWLGLAASVSGQPSEAGGLDRPHAPYDSAASGTADSGARESREPGANEGPASAASSAAVTLSFAGTVDLVSGYTIDGVPAPVGSPFTLDVTIAGDSGGTGRYPILAVSYTLTVGTYVTVTDWAAEGDLVATQVGDSISLVTDPQFMSPDEHLVIGPMTGFGESNFLDPGTWGGPSELTGDVIVRGLGGFESDDQLSRSGPYVGTLVLTVVSQPPVRHFFLEWSGASFENAATATARLTLDESILLNPGNNGFVVTPGYLPSFTITVRDASSGNGTWNLSDYGDIIWQTDTALDLTQELVGQPTSMDPWGTSQPGGTGGDFNLFGGLDGAPEGTWWFELATNAGQGDQMLLTSFRPSCVGDLDGDAVVGFADLLLILTGWGGAAQDLDGDRSTGFEDALIVLSEWGPCS